MLIRYGCFLAYAMSICALQAIRVDYNDSYQIVGHARGNHGTVAVLKSGRGESYVVKQIRKPDPSEQFQLVIDQFCCTIGRICGVPINNVACIPPGVPFAGKELVHLPATLHTFVPGVRFDHLDKAILAYFRDMNYYIYPVPDKVCMRYSVIRSIAQQRDLPKIAALDTFVGNTDRVPCNLLYDAEHDHFYAIDMANSYRGSTMVRDACRELKIMIKEKVQLRPQEREAVHLYVATLRGMLFLFPPKKQIELLVHYAQEAGFKEGSSLWDAGAKSRLYRHVADIKRNYKYCEKLVDLFEEFLR